MNLPPELKKIFKRLKLSQILATLPERLAYARHEKLDYTDFLQLVLGDEIERRDQRRVEIRLREAGFEEPCTLEGFDWSAKIRLDKTRLMELFGLHFIERHENVIFSGPVGVGKTFLETHPETALAEHGNSRDVNLMRCACVTSYTRLIAAS